MEYGKIINNELVTPTEPLIVDGKVMFNPQPEYLVRAGYKKIIYPLPSYDSSLSYDTSFYSSEDPSYSYDIFISTIDSSENKIISSTTYTEDNDNIYVHYTYSEPTDSINPSDERKQAYESEIDQYLIAYYGYKLEGNTAAANEQKALYLSKKAEIRSLYPDSSTDSSI